MKIKDIVLFEAAFDTRYATQGVGENQYWFITELGEKYIINFIGKGTIESPLEISFTLFNPSNNAPTYRGEDEIPTERRNTRKIFSTVIQTTRYYVDKHKPDYMHFSGLADLGRTYEIMAERLVPRLFPNYKMYKQMKGRTMHFIFVREKE